MTDEQVKVFVGAAMVAIERGDTEWVRTRVTALEPAERAQVAAFVDHATSVLSKILPHDG
jgi:hypothetical protein